MLTRQDTSGTTQFEWDGFDCVRETAPSSGSAVFDTATFDSAAEWGTTGLTQYYVVGGQLLELVRDNAEYSVVTDALGSVRLVLNSDGSTVSSFQYDAWGNLLSSSSDGLPGGMPYTFVGGLGVRRDEGSGLIWMRARWYDPTLQRFVSRDALGGTNRYAYANNAPSNFTDPSGLIVDIGGAAAQAYAEALALQDQAAAAAAAAANAAKVPPPPGWGLGALGPAGAAGVAGYIAYSMYNSPNDGSAKWRPHPYAGPSPGHKPTPQPGMPRDICQKEKDDCESDWRRNNPGRRCLDVDAQDECDEVYKNCMARYGVSSLTNTIS